MLVALHRHRHDHRAQSLDAELVLDVSRPYAAHARACVLRRSGCRTSVLQRTKEVCLRLRTLGIVTALGIVAVLTFTGTAGGVAQASSRNGGQGGGGAVIATISSFDPLSGTLVLITPTGGVITGIVLNGVTQIHAGGNCPSTSTGSLIQGRGVTQIQFFTGTNQFQSITLAGSGGGDDDTRNGDGGNHCQGVLASTISSFDRVSGTLTLITPAGGVVSGIVIRGTTHVLPGDCHGESSGFGGLKPGRGVTQFQLFPGTNVFQTITLAGGGGNGGGGDDDARGRDGNGDHGGHHCHGHGHGGGGGGDD